MADFGVPKDGLAPRYAHVITALDNNDKSNISPKEGLHGSYLVTVTPPNAVDVMVLNIDLRLHRFMHKKRRPLMTRRARRKMVR
jgi:hypothetical protein|nr:MAG TPA: hypothetical protein [Caudoviricetes sp.]